jgi:protein ImuB
MSRRRYLSLWFRHLVTDSHIRRQPASKDEPFVFSTREKNRDIVTFVSPAAAKRGICPGMVLSDARLLQATLTVIPGEPDPGQLLHRIALRCNRYSPVVAVDPPDGLFIDITGCAHLWGGEASYYKEIVNRMRAGGYDVRAAIADTPGAAWAFARYLHKPQIVPSGKQEQYLPQLPPTALRLSPPVLDRLRSLGMSRIRHILDQPRITLLPRFGKELLERLDQALGDADEGLLPVVPPVSYRERLPCLEPVVTAGGIEYALSRLLELLCHRLQLEAKGLRALLFRCHRVDGRVIDTTVNTTRPTTSITHLFKLYETKISSIEPGLGIELFTLEATIVGEAPPDQEGLWTGPGNTQLAELLDRIVCRAGEDSIARYFPAEHYWPERSFRRLPVDQDAIEMQWPEDPRPFLLFDPPEPIIVTAPIPDYPPMNFRHRGTLYTIAAASGPTRIENEWWIDNARPRDYYSVEDVQGARYWIFRSGHYEDIEPARWYIHGLFA